VISQIEFNKRCEEFNRDYRKVKKNKKTIESLSINDKLDINESFNTQPVVACKKGCAHCCYLRVVAFPHEIAAIHSYVHSNFLKDDKKLVLDKLENSFNEIKNMSVNEHITTNIECPFLINKSC
jgi:hypothetical protein